MKALVGPCPLSRIMFTGGVAVAKQSIKAWFKASEEHCMIA
jgi:2-keto-3-deoxy-6-phosphogluconate aldolase